MNPLKRLYKAIVPERLRVRIWKEVHSFPVRRRLWSHILRYRLTRRPARRVTILFYPDQPAHPAFALWKICRMNGWRVTTEPAADFDLAVNWEDKTWRTADQTTDGILRRGRCLNAGCLDISKAHIQEIFAEVFGYDLAVDPLTFKGECVIKSNVNFKHDGRIITCPVGKTEPECVYQKLINNRCAKDEVEEIRVPVFGSRIPFVSLKYRRIDNRFRDYYGSKIMNTDEVLSAQETELIRQFCRRLNLDCGELDVLRDVDDGRIYIVDANNTPSGPPRHLSSRDEWEALCRMSEAFCTEFLGA